MKLSRNTEKKQKKWQRRIERWLQSLKLKQLQQNIQLRGINCTDPEWTRECALYGWKAIDVYFPNNFTVHEDLFSGEKYSDLNSQRSIYQKLISKFYCNKPTLKGCRFWSIGNYVDFELSNSSPMSLVSNASSLIWKDIVMREIAQFE